ncbi:hypothetical protein ACFSQQ_03780 [Mesorhizobium kowhaii]|uniref:hypothetical protein n=1 Tax=Mesorhizobium kowhaii TaxID=1300272 RepID=UPI0035E63FFA
MDFGHRQIGLKKATTNIATDKQKLFARTGNPARWADLEGSLGPGCAAAHNRYSFNLGSTEIVL